MPVAARSTYHHGNLAAALIEAARTLIDAAGPDAVSLREAARQVGVSATATYRHFTDKDHLLAAVAAAGYRDFAERLTAARPQGFAAMGQAYVDFALAHPGMFRLMFGAIMRERTRFGELSAAADAAFAVLLEGAGDYAAGRFSDVESLAYAAWSFSHGLSRLVLDGVLPHDRAMVVCRSFEFAPAAG